MSSSFVSPLSSEFYPVEASVDGGNVAPIKMVRTKHGGHLGFMFHQLSETEMMVKRPASWMPLELARFVRHVHERIQ
jgi:predicted alpha/beta-fold hydrolase